MVAVVVRCSLFDVGCLVCLFAFLSVDVVVCSLFVFLLIVVVCCCLCLFVFVCSYVF